MGSADRTPDDGSSTFADSKVPIIDGTDGDRDGTQKKREDWDTEIDVHYQVHENPPLYLSILLAFQHYISMFVASLTIPILLAPATCMNEDNVGKAEITGTLFVASGLITLLQTIIGVRLPIVQAGTFALLAPTLAYLSLDKWKCPNILPPGVSAANMTGNDTWIETGSPEHREVWMIRFREIQGAIMCAAVVELVLGASGAVGLLLRFIGPLTICPTVSLLGLALFKSAAVYASKHWWICCLTILIVVVCSQYLGHFKVPCMGYSRSKGCHSKGYPIFKMFPIVFAIIVSWVLCFILTMTGVFPSSSEEWGYHARTDLRTSAIKYAPWFRMPYPGQWGTPTVSVSAVFAILAGILATTVESVGDYHACAKLSGAPPPPVHAINRGILIEAIGSMLDGMFGTGNGTTSTSVNVGVVGITKVGSRRVVQISALFMIVFGVFTKFGALFVSIPDPIIGGIFFILFGMIVAVGISNLQNVDLNSSRNLFIIGFSFFNGLSIPMWVAANKDSIQTGNETVDNILRVLLSTSMFMGGVTGFFLDNTIPGTDEERGIAYWKKMRESCDDDAASPQLIEKIALTYDLPFGMAHLRRWKWTRYVPFLPTFGKKYPDEYSMASPADRMVQENGGSGVDVESNGKNCTSL